MSYGILRDTIQGPHKGEIILDGSFRPNGASAPTVYRGNWISSIAHTADGVWTITMKEKFRGWQGILACTVSLRLNAYADTNIQFGAIDLDAGTIVVNAGTAGVAADIASNANNWIDVVLHLKYDKSQDGSGLV